MCVHAHPDDESSKGAATMARYVDAGHEVLVVSCTGGERGDILNPNLKDDPHILRDLAQVRRDEMRAAQEILGVQHTWLGFVDSGLPEGDPLPPLPQGCFALEPLEITTEALVEEIRRFRPHVITTYDEEGGYPHPDHIMCHDVTVAAFRAAGDPAAYPHAGPAWQPLKLYYNASFSRRGSRPIWPRSPRPASRIRMPTGSPGGTAPSVTSPPGWSAVTGSLGAMTRCGRTPRRSTRTASSS